MENNSSLVSIIMNCYNGEKYLKQSLNSILKQTYQNWELIFWDNRSTDNSKKIYKSFNDNRFKYIATAQSYDEVFKNIINIKGNSDKVVTGLML